jgi:2-amino-4-hydroxy-6-hydroxymethyldihydropteridine diphosphokinase
VSVYAIGLGSNRRGRHGSPADAIHAALARIGGVVAVSPVIATAPLGPSTRRFANAAALVASDEAPPVLLARLKAIERTMGRRPGRRWGARAVDLDILLWSGGRWQSRPLTIPHPHFRQRCFVLTPLARIAPHWRDPATHRTIRQLRAQVDHRRPST